MAAPAEDLITTTLPRAGCLVPCGSSTRLRPFSFPKSVLFSAARRLQFMRNPHSCARVCNFWSRAGEECEGGGGKTARLPRRGAPRVRRRGCLPRCAHPAYLRGQASPEELLCAAGASSFTPPLATRRLSITHNTLSQKVWEILHLWKHSGTSARSS